MRPTHHVGAVRATIGRLAPLTPFVRQASLVRWELDLSGRCQRPVGVELTGRRYRDVPDLVKGVSMADLQVRCRKCIRCRQARARLWTLRAIQETRVWPRTWFGTMTLTEHQHHLMLCRAQLRASKNGFDLTLEGEEAQHRRRLDEIGKEVTLYFKRIRKGNAQFRYLIVAEDHKSGLPHLHCLVHETSPEQPLSWRALSEQWHLGFTKFKLVPPGDHRAVRYLCKYLTKSQRARVRASLRYGEYGLRHNPDDDTVELGVSESISTPTLPCSSETTSPDDGDPPSSDSSVEGS